MLCGVVCCVRVTRYASKLRPYRKVVKRFLVLGRWLTLSTPDTREAGSDAKRFILRWTERLHDAHGSRATLNALGRMVHKHEVLRPNEQGALLKIVFIF